MKRIILLYFILSFLAICNSGCRQNTNQSKENLIVASGGEKSENVIVSDSIKNIVATQVIDSVHLNDNYSKTDDIDVKYSVKELTKLSDTIYKKMLNSAVRHNVAMSSLLENPNRISVVLVNYDEQHINQFKTEVSDSRAIVFEEMRLNRPKGESCDSCGIEMLVVPNTYLLPVNTVKLQITNNTGAEITTGESFYLEQFKNGRWEGVRLMYNFNSLGLLIGSREHRFIEINLQPETHQYELGKYRIVKKIPAKQKMYLMSADFKIE